MNKLILVLALWASTSLADDTTETMIAEAGTCAAVTMLVAVKTEGMAGEIIMTDARWWKAYLQMVATIYNSDVTEKQVLGFVEVVATNVQESYNSGSVSWNDLVDGAQECSRIKASRLEQAGMENPYEFE